MADDLIKKREVDLGKFWKSGMDMLHQKLIKDLVKDINKGGNSNQNISKSVEKELKKAQSNLGMTRKILK